MATRGRSYRPHWRQPRSQWALNLSLPLRQRISAEATMRGVSPSDVVEDVLRAGLGMITTTEYDGLAA